MLDLNMKQSLMLLRHAEAVGWASGNPDAGRVLSEHGLRHARAIAVWMSRHLAPPDAVLCSTAARTRETLQALSECWRALPECTVWNEDIYLAPAGTLHARAEDIFEHANTLLIVAHNPGIETLLRMLLCRQDAARFAGVPAGALAVVDFEHGWAPSAGDGRLRHWIREQDLSVN
jgi:phosphohistidine phosphatase